MSGTSPYYAFNRADIAQHIPEWATRVLDVGCASGAFGGLLKSLGVSEVIGIEVEPDVCAAAQDVLDCAICGDIETMDLPFEGGYFDCIVFGDVLEHLKNPGEVLKRVAPFLGPDGEVLASIPNVRFYDVIRALGDGRWEYQDAGILDRTHLRFFTAVEMQKLFADAGYEVVKLLPLSRAVGIPRNPDGTVTAGKVTIGPLDEAEYQDLLTYQYLIVGRKPL